MAERRTWTGAIRSAADVRTILDSTNRRGLERVTTTALAEVVRSGDDTELTPDASKLLPIDERLAGLLPWPGGLRRGATVAAVGSTSLLMVLLAAGMSQGSWAAVAGVPTFGALAAGQDYGVPLDRAVLIPELGPDWQKVTAALIDGVDLVVVASPPDVTEPVLRSLQARARQRGTVLIPTSAWLGSDLVIECTNKVWTGLGRGHGRLRAQELQLTAIGRGRAARPRTATVVVPAPAAPPQIPSPQLVLLHDPPASGEPHLWRDVEPNSPPADAWAGLQVTGTSDWPGFARNPRLDR
jgi:hypothetical protein